MGVNNILQGVGSNRVFKAVRRTFWYVSRLKKRIGAKYIAEDCNDPFAFLGLKQSVINSRYKEALSVNK